MVVCTGLVKNQEDPIGSILLLARHSNTVDFEGRYLAANLPVRQVLVAEGGCVLVAPDCGMLVRVLMIFAHSPCPLQRLAWLSFARVYKSVFGCICLRALALHRNLAAAMTFGTFVV